MTRTAFELQTAGRSMRYVAPEGVIGAASTFGGRWRVTDLDGHPLFSLAPAGAPGTDDREIVPYGEPPTATIMRDRRRGDSWMVLDHDGELVLRATLDGPYDLVLTDASGAAVGRLWATTTALIVELEAFPRSLVLALPLYFATTGALRVESLETPRSSLHLWS